MTRHLHHEIDIVSAFCLVDFLSFIRQCFDTLSPNSEFFPNWHIEKLVYELDLVRLGQSRRLIYRRVSRHGEELQARSPAEILVEFREAA